MDSNVISGTDAAVRVRTLSQAGQPSPAVQGIPRRFCWGFSSLESSWSHTHATGRTQPASVSRRATHGVNVEVSHL